MSRETILAYLEHQGNELEAFLATETASLIVHLPEGHELDSQHVSQLASTVAASSNQYAKLARLAGVARANAKIAKGRYERKIKMGSSQGKNKEARDSEIFAQAATEHATYTYADALATLIETLLDAARIASESSRKLLDRHGDIFRGEHRADAARQY
jgi:hypothetical protein